MRHNEKRGKVSFTLISVFLCNIGLVNFNILFLFFQIDANGTIFTNNSFTVSLQEQTLFEASCALIYETSESWFTEFDFSVTNDGEKFTEKYSVYVYQSQCQTLRNESGIISVTLQVCFSFWRHIDISCEHYYRCVRYSILILFIENISKKVDTLMSLRFVLNLKLLFWQHCKNAYIYHILYNTTS